MGHLLEPIISEEVLEEVFSYLPDMSFEEDGTEFPVRFGYGDEVELNVFLKNREVSDVYPLIWMLYPQTEKHLKNSVRLEKATFILSVTTNQSMENSERIKLTYRKILIPLMFNIRLLFRQSNVISVYDKEEKYIVTKHPNFSESTMRDKTGAVAIWDALKITVDLDIIGGCIKPIKFFK